MVPHLVAVLVVLEAGEVVHEPIQLLEALVLFLRLWEHKPKQELVNGKNEPP